MKSSLTFAIDSVARLQALVSKHQIEAPCCLFTDKRFACIELAELHLIRFARGEDQLWSSHVQRGGDDGFVFLIEASSRRRLNSTINITPYH